MNSLGRWILALAVMCPGILRAEEPSATLTSDEMEIRDNGEVTSFRGHVVVKELPYELRADQMRQTKATGVVDAEGNIAGVWYAKSGEKVKAFGRKGRYQPSPETTELWDHAKLIRWEKPD